MAVNPELSHNNLLTVHVFFLGGTGDGDEKSCQECQILEESYQVLKNFVSQKGGTLAKISKLNFYVILVYICRS